MKRGLITWDKAELPPAVFEARLSKARAALAERDLPALLVYSDVWRSTEGRHLTNYMPYWNRSLIVIPSEAPPILLCGLSPRVYPWIKSVTIFEEIRPASKLVPALLQLCTERGWARLAVLDLPGLPHEIHLPLEASTVGVFDVRLELTDEAEIAMHRRAEQMASEILAAELLKGAGLTDYQFSGRLERAFRRAGAEDLVLLFSTGGSVPRPARGVMLGDQYSVAVALEYRGHWARLRLGLQPGSLPL
jgi:Xaa-Pro aminopeptidase